MTAPKFTHRDRAQIAAQLFASLPATKPDGIGQKLMTIAERVKQAAVHADALLTVIAETPAPACVDEDMDALDVVAALLPYAKGQLSRLQSIADEDGLSGAGNSAFQRVTEDVQRTELLLRENGRLP